MIQDCELNGNKEKHLFGLFPQQMLNINDLTPKAFKINLRCVIFFYLNTKAPYIYIYIYIV